MSKLENIAIENKLDLCLIKSQKECGSVLRNLGDNINEVMLSRIPRSSSKKQPKVQTYPCE